MSRANANHVLIADIKYASSFGTCFVIPSSLIGATYITPVCLLLHLPTCLLRSPFSHQVFIESVVAVATLWHAIQYGSLLQNTKSEGVLRTLYLDGYMYFIVRSLYCVLRIC